MWYERKTETASIDDVFRVPFEARRRFPIDHAVEDGWLKGLRLEMRMASLWRAAMTRWRAQTREADE